MIDEWARKNFKAVYLTEEKVLLMGEIKQSQTLALI